MEVIVKITQKELDTAVKYERHLRKDPCKDCPPRERRVCCGCNLQSEWIDNFPDIGMTRKEYEESLLKHYASARCNYEDAERREKMKGKPTRCVDPVLKRCLYCEWRWIEYPDETSKEYFKCGCTLGYDKGRPEDEPTAEESAVCNKPIDALPADGTKVTIKLKTGEILTGCWYHEEPRKSFYKYKTGCFSVDAVEWWFAEKEDINGN